MWNMNILLDSNNHVKIEDIKEKGETVELMIPWETYYHKQDTKHTGKTEDGEIL